MMELSDLSAKQLANYLPMWTTEKDDYVLLRSSDHDVLMVANVRMQTIRMIEDNERNELITRQMLRAGVPVVDSLPWTKKNKQ